MKFRDIVEGKNTKSKCSDELHALAKKTNGSETREIQVIAGKLDNFATTGNPGVVADAAKVLKQMDDGPRAKVMEIIKKSDPSMARSLARKAGLNEEVDELSEGKKLRNVLSDNELKKSMQKALADKSNYKGGKVNWPFIDADVYMELSAKGYDLRHPSINYMDRFDAMADMLDPMNETELEDELDEARGTAAKYAGKKGMFGGKYTSDDKKLAATIKDKDGVVSRYADKKLAQRKADHLKTDPEFGKYHARNMIDTKKAEKKAAKKGIKNPKIDWKQKNGVKRGKLPESQDEEFVLQALADADINASIDGNIVMVDKSDVRGAQKVLKEIGCTRKVKAGLNENFEDMQPASPDEESMAMNQARFVRYVSKEIMEYLEQGNEFPEWMQNKLTELNVKAKDFHASMAGKYKMDEDAGEEV
jgi:hypothetical protein